MVSAGPPALQFDAHNLALEPERQEDDTSLFLELVTARSIAIREDGKKYSLTGYYKVEGPGVGLKDGSAYIAILDSVIVFKLRE